MSEPVPPEWQRRIAKLGVREHVLVKADKLCPHQLALVRARFDSDRLALENQAVRAPGGEPGGRRRTPGPRARAGGAVGGGGGGQPADLSRIPWTRALRRVPEIAHAHHEKLDGRGYPRGVPGGSIPVEARMMTIADVYDALTASDRPYKKALPPEKALEILDADARRGQLDAGLLAVFVGARVYLGERT